MRSKKNTDLPKQYDLPKLSNNFTFSVIKVSKDMHNYFILNASLRLFEMEKYAAFAFFAILVAAASASNNASEDQR